MRVRCSMCGESRTLDNSQGNYGCPKCGCPNYSIPGWKPHLDN